MFKLLDRLIATIAASAETIGCVVLRGAGRAFCVGHDLDAFTAGMEEAVAKRIENGVIERLIADILANTRRANRAMKQMVLDTDGDDAACRHRL